MNPQARVTGGPLIASHVGADAAADLVAVDAVARGGSFLLVDIGTNSEIIVSDGSAAPRRVEPGRAGVRGRRRALRDARRGRGDRDGPARGRPVRGLARSATCRPEGICGSGLVDLLAELRRAGWMSDRGTLRATRPARSAWSPGGRSRFSRSDVGHLSIAKAATAVGQRVLLRRLGLEPADLDRVYLAGGFANAIDAAVAIDIGLLAPVPAERVRPGGQRVHRAVPVRCSLPGGAAPGSRRSSGGSSTSSSSPSPTSSTCSPTAACSNRSPI